MTDERSCRIICPTSSLRQPRCDTLKAHISDASRPRQFAMNRESRANAETQIEIVEADLARADHQQAIVALIDAYAADPLGNGRPLSAEVRETLIPELRQHPPTLILLAYQAGAAVGIAVCFRGFSTFAARPLINIHDLAVLPTHRGQGIGRRLLESVAAKAKETGCCKLTLEVGEHNRTARRLYEAVGLRTPNRDPQSVPFCSIPSRSSAISASFTVCALEPPVAACTPGHRPLKAAKMTDRRFRRCSLPTGGASVPADRFGDFPPIENADVAPRVARGF